MPTERFSEDCCHPVNSGLTEAQLPISTLSSADELKPKFCKAHKSKNKWQLNPDLRSWSIVPKLHAKKPCLLQARPLAWAGISPGRRCSHPVYASGRDCYELRIEHLPTSISTLSPCVSVHTSVSQVRPTIYIVHCHKSLTLVIENWHFCF